MAALRLVVISVLALLPMLLAQDARDAFATPEGIGLVTDGLMVGGSYERASLEAGEAEFYAGVEVPIRRGPPGGTNVRQSIWFTFRVPTAGVWNIRAGYPSDWAPVAVSYPVVFEEAPLASALPLFPIQENPSEGKCVLQAGKTYRLGLRTESLQRSYYEITFTKLRPPSNDAIAQALTVTGNRVEIAPGGATLEPGEVPPIKGVIGSAWVKWTAPAAGVWLIKSPSIGTSMYWPLQPTPLFDRSIPSDSQLDVWTPYGFLPTQRYFALFATASFDDPAAVLSQGGSWILFNAEAGQPYWIAGYDRWQGNFTIPLEMELACPNDLRENAQPLGSASAIREYGHLLGATVSEGEILPADFQVARTLWFSWSARSSGPVMLEVENSGGSGRVAVQAFSGSGVAGGTVAGSWGREWNFTAVAGETYQFQISATADPDTGFLLRLLAGEPADQFAAAIPLDGVALLSTVGCTLEAGEPAVAAGEGSVWLRWHSTLRQVVNVSLQTMQALGDWNSPQARMEVYTGTTLAGLIPTCVPNTATFLAEPGLTYHIRVLTLGETDGEAKITLVARPTAEDFDSLLLEAGALATMAGTGRDEQALARVQQALLIRPDDAGVRLAAAFLELRLATQTPSGRILAARISPKLTDNLPVTFNSAAAAGPDGAVPDGLTFKDFLAAFDADTWPHISTALGHLIAITEPAATFSHYTLPVYPTGRGGAPGYVTDAHDRRTIVAMIMALRGTLDYLSSLDGTVPAKDFFGWLCDGSPTLEALLHQFPGFLTLAPTDQRFTAWLWFTAASAQADMANGLYQAPFAFSSDQSLFTAATRPQIDRWFSWIRSCNGPTQYTWDGRVDISRWLFGTQSPRSLLPEVVGNRLLAHSVADVTFAGLLPDSTAEKLHYSWASRGWLAGHEELSKWLIRYFPIATPESSEDPDNDGITLLHEYAFGLSPTSPDPAPYQAEFQRLQQPDGSWQSRLDFRRRIALNGGDYVMEQSADLVNWTLSDAMEETSADTIPGFERVTARIPDDPLGNGRAFFRVRFRPRADGSGIIGVVSGN
jgi:hypothetical protein